MTGLLFFIVVVLIVLLFSLNNRKNKEIVSLKSQIEKANLTIQQLTDSNSELVSENSNLQVQIDSLSKYRGLIDIEEKANQIIAEADDYKQNIINQELGIISQANETLSNAKQQANTILEQAQTKFDSLVDKAEVIVKNAELKAIEIAGDAYEAMKNADDYQKTVIAMKNIIKGYGDEYLKPTFNLLDDLAEEFSHVEAGQKLKIARERNISLMRTAHAATCSYVEQNRKITAINFVLDAFNGKVDSILSKVKKDNYGILEQKIKDSFHIVNNNGKAFRDAAITKEYLESRLDELKWAVITQELKWQEKEEQRIIREQIKEEEKARREYEKAIKEAEKEEQLLRKLIDKAQKEVAKANEQEKSRFAAQLEELQGKLKVAEEKNQRAISMAQQTKAGNVYIISNIGSFGEDIFKIGMTRRLEPLDRVRELGDASVPFEFDVHALIYSDNAPLLERKLHKKFLKLQLNKINPRKEFFKVNLSEIREACTELGITAKWTMIAEAKQYRESLALAEALANDKQLEAEWENLQEVAEIEIQDAEMEAIE